MTYDDKNLARIIKNAANTLDLTYLQLYALRTLGWEIDGVCFDGDKPALIEHLLEIKKPLPLSCDAALALQHFIELYENRITEEIERACRK